MAKRRAIANPAESSKKSWLWVTVSAASFIIVLFLTIFFVPTIINNPELGGIIYYIILIPLAIAAAFLFQTSTSSFSFTGKVLNGRLRLSGSVVVACLVVAGGTIVPDIIKIPDREFDLHVYFYGDKLKSTIIREGIVRFVYDGKSETKNIDLEGKITLSGLRTTLKGKDIQINVFAENFYPAREVLRIPDQGKTIEVVLNPKTDTTHLYGNIIDTKNQPLSNATIYFGQYQSTTDQLGAYELKVPMPVGTTLQIRIYAEGKMIYTGKETLSADFQQIKINN